jgi:hypothetical protein
MRDDRMTEAQAGYLKSLSESAGVPFDPNLSKADASRRIDELRRADGKRSRLERDDPTPRKGQRVREAASFGDRMTDAQAAYLRELIDQGDGEEFDPSMSREAAQAKIAELLVKRLSHSPTEASRR